jgi:hypothetical protein
MNLLRFRMPRFIARHYLIAYSRRGASDRRGEMKSAADGETCGQGVKSEPSLG